MSNCISCGEELNALDKHPNGDMPATCARCTAEEGHDFDKEPGVEFNRCGVRVTPYACEAILKPDWATGLAPSWHEVGAALPTKDGRRTGNACIIGKLDDKSFIVLTDAGNKLVLNIAEIDELFWPAKYLMNPADAPGLTNVKEPL